MRSLAGHLVYMEEERRIVCSRQHWYHLQGPNVFQKIVAAVLLFQVREVLPQPQGFNVIPTLDLGSGSYVSFNHVMTAETAGLQRSYKGRSLGMYADNLSHNRHDNLP